MTPERIVTMHEFQLPRRPIARRHPWREEGQKTKMQVDAGLVASKAEQWKRGAHRLSLSSCSAV